jgi:hypothetical protein
MIIDVAAMIATAKPRPTKNRRRCAGERFMP